MLSEQRGLHRNWGIAWLSRQAAPAATAALWHGEPAPFASLELFRVLAYSLPFALPDATAPGLRLDFSSRAEDKGSFINLLLLRLVWSNKPAAAAGAHRRPSDPGLPPRR